MTGHLDATGGAAKLPDGMDRAIVVALVAAAPLTREMLTGWLQGVLPACRIENLAGAQDMVALLADGQRPDLVVIAGFLSESPGERLAAAVDRICRASDGWPVVVVSATADPVLQREFLGCGARAHISTRMQPSAAAAVINLVLSGGVYDSIEGRHRPARGDTQGTPRVPPTLSPREREVLSLLERGHSNRRIAVTLGISENTVMVHLRHIMRKLGATNRTQAVFNAGRLIDQSGVSRDV